MCFYVIPCPSKDWHALGPTGPIRSLRPNYVPPDPFKRGRKSPLQDLQGGANPKSIKIDIAHTYAIAGYGKDDLASCLVFLAVRCEIWGPGRYEDQLERAWVSFKAWCVANKKSTTILEFSKKELKITSQLGQCLSIFLRSQGCIPRPQRDEPHLRPLCQVCLSWNCWGCKTFPEVLEKDPTQQWWELGWRVSYHMWI